MARGQGQADAGIGVPARGDASADHILYGATDEREQSDNASDELLAPRLDDDAKVLVADVLDLDLDDRMQDMDRDQEMEELLISACARLRQGKDLTEEQAGPVSDVIAMNLDEREGDQERDQEAEQILSGAHSRLVSW